jgi:hypothetical protein
MSHRDIIASVGYDIEKRVFLVQTERGRRVQLAAS